MIIIRRKLENMELNSCPYFRQTLTDFHNSFIDKTRQTICIPKIIEVRHHN